MSAAEALNGLLLGPAAPLGAVVALAGELGSGVAAGGIRHPDGGQVSEATRFDLASVTKVVATTCALHRLAALGEIGFDDKISRYMSWVPTEPGTTLRDVLQHRAGLWEWQPLYLAGDDPMATIATLRPRYRLRAGRHYSDLGFMLLGQVISAVTGSGLAPSVATLITDPLGLSSLRYGPIHSDVAASSPGDQAELDMVRRAEPYPVLFEDRGFAWREQVISGVANDGNAFHAFGGVAGHAGLFGSAADLLQLALSLASPEANEFWGTTVRKQVYTDGPDAGQALGWRSRLVLLGKHRKRLLWHPGFTGCAVGFVPDEGVAVVMLSNRLFAARPVPTATLWELVLANVGPFALVEEGQ